MPHSPTTPVRVPKAAVTYSPATQDPDLRSQINTILLRDGHVQKISDHLSNALSTHPDNFPAAVRSHATALLRSGEYTAFPALMARVLDDVRAATAAATAAAASTSPTAAATTNGRSKDKERGAGKLPKGKERERGGGGGGAAASSAAAAVAAGRSAANEVDERLAVPRAVLDEGVRITRECLELVCEVDD